jgi:hypothetical protein
VLVLVGVAVRLLGAAGSAGVLGPGIVKSTVPQGPHSSVYGVFGVISFGNAAEVSYVWPAATVQSGGEPVQTSSVADQLRPPPVSDEPRQTGFVHVSGELAELRF